MKLCKHLNYARSLSPGKAVFFYKTKESEFVPLKIETTKISGQKSSYSEAFIHDLESKNVQGFELAYSNPQTIEACYVPPNIENIYCRFSLRVEANSLSPDICANIDVRNQLTELAKQYDRCGGYKELASRYAKNILMGTWLWRNKNTLCTQIDVKTSLGTTLSLDDVRLLSWHELWDEKNQKQLDQLTAELSKALSNPSLFWFSDITAKLSTSFCQEIYPSQLFIEKEKQQHEASKKLATVECPDGAKAACFHSQKIGAALQQIDDWWMEDADSPIRIHEYGADKKNQTALRHPVTQRDFYHLLSKTETYVDKLKSLADDSVITDPDVHFLMAVLCKGGLFQGGKE